MRNIREEKSMVIDVNLPKLILWTLASWNWKAGLENYENLGKKDNFLEKSEVNVLFCLLFSRLI